MFCLFLFSDKSRRLRVGVSGHFHDELSHGHLVTFAQREIEEADEQLIDPLIFLFSLCPLKDDAVTRTRERFELFDRHEVLVAHTDGHIPISMTYLWILFADPSFGDHPALESRTHLGIILHWTRLAVAFSATN